MRKIIIAIFVIIVIGGIAATFIEPDDRTDEQIFKESMNFAHWETYVDPCAGYSFKYPSFFTMKNDDHHGNVTFNYNNHNIDLILECKVDTVIDKTSNSNDFIDEGQLPDFDGYHYYSHHVLHEGKWYILTLYYLYSFHEGVSRIRYSIKHWRPFSKSLVVPFHSK